jgi:hypothetical protein
MELGDGAIDARGEAEVVRVDDEARGHRDETQARGRRTRGRCPRASVSYARVAMG